LCTRVAQSSWPTKYPTPTGSTRKIGPYSCFSPSMIQIRMLTGSRLAALIRIHLLLPPSSCRFNGKETAKQAWPAHRLLFAIGRLSLARLTSSVRVASALRPNSPLYWRLLIPQNRGLTRREERRYRHDTAEKTLISGARRDSVAPAGKGAYEATVRHHSAVQRRFPDTSEAVVQRSCRSTVHAAQLGCCHDYGAQEGGRQPCGLSFPASWQ
jgi:hypothetical protein